MATDERDDDGLEPGRAGVPGVIYLGGAGCALVLAALAAVGVWWIILPAIPPPPKPAPVPPPAQAAEAPDVGR